jgi:hypothetical protein
MYPYDREPEKTAKGATCQRCGSVVDGDLHRNGDLRVCESCYIDLWRPHHRKPHWCYIKSIKGDYVKPAPVD